MLKKILSTLLIVFSMSALAGTTHTIPFTSNKDPIKVTQNQRFDIILPANASTGYTWKWDATPYDQNLVALVSHHYVAPSNTKMIGAPGYEVWQFKAKSGDYRVVQVGHIVMEYQRSWEKTPGSKKTFIVHIK